MGWRGNFIVSKGTLFCLFTIYARNDNELFAAVGATPGGTARARDDRLEPCPRKASPRAENNGCQPNKKDPHDVNIGAAPQKLE